MSLKSVAIQFKTCTFSPPVTFVAAFLLGFATLFLPRSYKAPMAEFQPESAAYVLPAASFAPWCLQIWGLEHVWLPLWSLSTTRRLASRCLAAHSIQLLCKERRLRGPWAQLQVPYVVNVAGDQEFLGCITTRTDWYWRRDFSGSQMFAIGILLSVNHCNSLLFPRARALQKTREAESKYERLGLKPINI